MPVTQKDIAQKLGISQQAVASALSGKGGSRMSEETRSRVLEEAHRLGYRPNLAARALTQQRTNLIAVWTRNLASPYYGTILQHIEAQLRDTDFEMIVRVIPGEEPGFKHMDNWQTAQWPVDGVLAIEATGVVNRFIQSRGGSHCPVVCLGAYDPTSPSLDYVWIDLYQGSLDAIRHLIGQGCRRVATVIHDLGYGTESPRFRAYNDAIKEAGLEPEYIIVPNTRRATGYTAVLNYTAEHGFPDGLFCYNDDLALGAFRALRESGKSVPNDVAIVGCDGIADTQFLDQPLSTVVAPLEDMCSQGWAMLQRRMMGLVGGPQNEALEAQLEIRASSSRY